MALITMEMEGPLSAGDRNPLPILQNHNSTASGLRPEV